MGNAKEKKEGEGRREIEIASMIRRFTFRLAEEEGAAVRCWAISLSGGKCGEKWRTTAQLTCVHEERRKGTPPPLVRGAFKAFTLVMKFAPFQKQPIERASVVLFSFAFWLLAPEIQGRPDWRLIFWTCFGGFPLSQAGIRRRRGAHLRHTSIEGEIILNKIFNVLVHM